MGDTVGGVAGSAPNDGIGDGTGAPEPAEPPVDELGELTELALAADPDEALADDAAPWVPDGAGAPMLLPEWYMPAPQAAGATPRRVLAAVVIVGSLLLVNGVGLCVTYGFPEIAW